MFHPWRTLRQMEDWTLEFAHLPAGVLGATDAQARTIYLKPGMTQAQRRSTLAHELEHVADPVALEHCVDAEAVRKLIPLDRLTEALRWSYDEYEMSRELWVDVPTVRARLAGLTKDEQDEIERALDDDWR